MSTVRVRYTVWPESGINDVTVTVPDEGDYDLNALVAARHGAKVDADNVQVLTASYREDAR